MRLRPAVLVSVLLAAMLPAVAPATPATAALSIPSGFSVATIQSGHAPHVLTDYIVLPDGSRITTSKQGAVKWVSADQATIRSLAQLPVHGHFDIGLLSIWPARDYDTTGHIYAIYPKTGVDAAHPGTNEVARYKVDNPSSPTSLVRDRVVLGGITQDLNYHGAGSVVAAPDGSMYASFGDSTTFTRAEDNALRAQNIDDPHGKLLRFDPETGRGLPTNPFYDAANPSSWRSRVFAMGMRNPTRFSLDPRTGHVYIGDVGWGHWEEINLARGGENFGWPCYEGNAQTRLYLDNPRCKAIYAAHTRHDLPLYTYSHNNTQAAAIGGPFYTGTSYPAQYRGRMFFADYAQSNLRTIGTDVNGKVTSPGAIFGTDVGAPVSMHTEINGDISYADILTSTIKRIRYTSGNRAPTAVATATNDPATLKVTVDASESSDLDGDVLTFSTNFGDGTPAVPGVKPSHTYADGSKTYDVTVTARDPYGATGTTTLKVKPANHTPVLTLAAPPASQRFAVGAPVTVSATATDPDGTPPATSYSVVLQHCPFGGGCHAHPTDQGTGPAYNTTFPDHGDDTKMVITFTATDADGATARAVYEALPDVRQLAVVSPVPVKVNGATVTSMPVVAGAEVSVEAPPLAAGRQFASWSDGGAATHTFAMPAADLTLTANYLTEIATKYAQPGVAAAMGPPTTAAEYTYTGGSLLGGKARGYKNGVIMWSPSTGAHYVKGALYQRYWQGAHPYVYGFPVADEVVVPGGGYASYFQRGREYWSAKTGARFVKGAILTRYLSLGGPAWGYPTTDEAAMSDATGYISHFTGARSIVWHRTVGARVIRDPIRAKWASLGWQRSCLGYPSTDELTVSVGRQVNFQRGGAIVWNTRTGVVSHVCRR